MTLLKINMTANFFGTAWQSVLGIIFIPMYISIVGIESWGLIGFFVTLQVLMSLMDLGMGATLTRELARMSVLPEKSHDMRNLVYNLEIIFCFMALFIALFIACISSILTDSWIITESLSPASVEKSIFFMGLVIAFQMPAGVYSAGLSGLQRQVALNSINIVISTLRAVGSLAVLEFISPSIDVYFLWQVIISFLNVIILRYYLWKFLPWSVSPNKFQLEILRGIWEFAAGMSGITLFSIAITQLDKIVLSKLLSMENFGYYTLASMVAENFKKLFSPVFFSIYPRFTQLVTEEKFQELGILYHKTSQFIAILVFPVVSIIIFFSYDILLLWTGNPKTAENSYILLMLMISGTAINGILNTPYALQLSFGWTKLQLYKTAIITFFLVPTIIILFKFFGATGVASVWLIINVILIIVEIPITHSKLLKSEMLTWYLHDVFYPFIVCAAISFLAVSIYPGYMTKLFLFFYLLAFYLLLLTFAVFSTNHIRQFAFDYILGSVLFRNLRNLFIGCLRTKNEK